MIFPAEAAVVNSSSIQLESQEAVLCDNIISATAVLERLHTAQTIASAATSTQLVLPGRLEQHCCISSPDQDTAVSTVSSLCDITHGHQDHDNYTLSCHSRPSLAVGLSATAVPRNRSITTTHSLLAQKAQRLYLAGAAGSTRRWKLCCDSHDITVGN